MSRDTSSFIGADGQISSASQSSGTNGTVSNSAGMALTIARVLQ